MAILAGVILMLLAGAAGFLYWQAQAIVGELQAGAKRPIVEQARLVLGTEPTRSLALLLRGMLASFQSLPHG